jgi:hypothetical protein
MRHIFFGKPVVRLRRPPANGFEPSGLNRKLRNFKTHASGWFLIGWNHRHLLRRLMADRH